MIDNVVQNETKAREKEPSYTDLICASVVINFVSAKGRKLYETIPTAGEFNIRDIVDGIARIEEMHQLPLRMRGSTREDLEYLLRRKKSGTADVLNELDR